MVSPVEGDGVIRDCGRATDCPSQRGWPDHLRIRAETRCGGTRDSSTYVRPRFNGAGWPSRARSPQLQLGREALGPRVRPGLWLLPQCDPVLPMYSQFYTYIAFTGGAVSVLPVSQAGTGPAA
jgi:hypothetical protein